MHVSQNKTGGTAVIAVHGVGTPVPGSMVRDIAALLQSSNPGVYGDFCECSYEISVTPLSEIDIAQKTDGDSPRSDGEAPKKSKAHPWYVRSRYVSLKVNESISPGPIDAPRRLRESAEGEEAPPPRDPEMDDVLFTREATAKARLDYESSIYRSIRIGGARTSNGTANRVDLFEMYWGDLSRLPGWIGRILGEFYQILFHLASVGQKTVELAWLKSKSERSRLESVLKAQTLTESMLAGVLPVLVLALLFAILPVFGQLASDSILVHATIIALIFAGGIAALLSYLLWQDGSLDSLPDAALRRRGIGIFIAYSSTLPAGFSASLLWIGMLGKPSGVVLFVTLSFVSLAAFYWCARQLANRRSEGGAVSTDVATFIGAAIWLSLLALGTSSRPFGAPATSTQIAMTIGEGMFVLIACAWTVFIFAAWATCLLGFIASFLSNSWRTKAAIWTGKIGIFVPASLFFVVSLLGWQLLTGFVKNVPNVRYQSIFPSWSAALLDGVDCRGTAETVHECIDRLLTISAGPGFNAFIAMSLGALALLVVALLPSIIFEIFPAVGDSPRLSERMGLWLDTGFILSRIAGYISLIGFLGVLPILQLSRLLQWGAWLRDIQGDSTLRIVAAVIISSAGFLVALRGVAFKGTTKAIGIALDIDNWLKEVPIERNPRGRISLRYLALLRHVCAMGYDRVVIVSHSQGTVITADLLRYLEIFPVPGITSPIRLMTFGSPIRQIYGLRFPHLYHWARSDRIHPRVPDVHELARVDHWVNGYRSGDYIGRFFWTGRGQWAPWNWRRLSREIPPHGSGQPSTPPRLSVDTAEFCVGAGAHTHYFDGTASNVGREIDRQIA